MKSSKTRKPHKKRTTERFTVIEIQGKLRKTWQVSGYKRNGERVRVKFKTLPEAEAEKKALDLEALGEKKQNITELTKAQLDDAKAALEILKGHASLVEAATYFRNNYKQVSGKPLRDAIIAYEQDRETTRVAKTGKPRSERTLYEIKNRLGAFEDFMIERAIIAETGDKKLVDDALEELKAVVSPKAADQVVSSDIEAFLADKGASWNNYRSKLSGFFSWCVKQHICASNPVEAVERHGSEGNKEYFTIGEVKSLLEAAQTELDGAFLAYVSIALFAGLRPDSELKKLTWKDVGLKSKKMRVPAGKTGKARAIEMPENLIQWLEACDRTKPILPTGSFQRGFAKVKRAAGFKGGVRDTKTQREIDDAEGMKPWVVDYTRHTFISYYIAKHSDIYKTATVSGNSPQMIQDHYDGLIVDAEAIDAFWELTPKSLSKSNLVDIRSA